MRGRWMIGAALLALAACGRSGGDAQRGTGNVAVGGTLADITISTPNGTTQVHTGTGAPSGLPEGIPAYPNVQAGQSVDISGASVQGTGRILSFSTPDAPAQVIAFYAQAVGAGGYTVANRMDMGATSSLTATRGEGQAVNIVATQAGGATQVQIIIGASVR